MDKERDGEQWNNYEQAIQEVEDLVFDDRFIEVLHRQSIQETASYTQGAIPSVLKTIGFTANLS